VGQRRHQDANAADLGFARSFASSSWASFAAVFRSNEYTPVRSGERAANARRPAGVIRRSLSSSSARATLTALQMLVASAV